MSMELYGWLVPIGALVLAGFGILYADFMSRRLDRQMREEREALQKQRPAE